MVLFISSETTFFGALFSAFFAIGGPGALHEGRELDLVIPLVITSILVTSSLTAHRALHAAQGGKADTARKLLLVTMGLGLLFLTGQAIEYSGLDFALGDDASTTLFFTMTGFHGLHVFGGILMLGAAYVRAGRPDPRRPIGGRVEAVVAYWHFVDVVWIGLVVALYLIK
jgi:cytochrome c oxidase subunit 3